jgi:uncharacterized protein (DUF427 family)
MPSAKVLLNGQVIAESDKTIIVEGNHYFPPESVSTEFFSENDRHTTCHWKGVANYFDIAVDGKESGSAAWTYREPSHAAERIKDYVAFYGHKVDTIEG